MPLGALFTTAALTLAAAGAVTAPAAAVHFVDSVNGNDAHSGTVPDQAWQSLDRANTAALNPGDQLLLARGSHFATLLAALSEMEREYIRDRTLEGHESARSRGKSIGGAGVTDDHMLSMALHLRGQELGLPDIASRLVISKGKKKGQHLSPATSCACCASTTMRPPWCRRAADRAPA